MTTYIDKTGTTTYNKGKFKPHDRQRVRVAKCQHNAAATAIPASNVVNIIPIPAESVILGACLEVETKQDNTDVKLGLTADDDLFAAAVDTATNSTSVAPTTIGTMQGQPYYTNAATNVVVTAVTNAINAAIFTVTVTYIELDAQVSKN